MIFFISKKFIAELSECNYKVKEFYIYTSRTISIDNILKYLYAYGIELFDESLNYRSNELNSNYIYYDEEQNISNSIYFYSKLEFSMDVVGVFQRLTGPDYCNFGSRTIYNNVKKSLPSKNYLFKKGNLIIVDTNSRLNYGLNKINSELVNKLEKRLIDFHKNIINQYNQVHVALSGGLDSRLALCALLNAKSNLIDKKEIKLISYGGIDSLDVKIAMKIAKSQKLSFTLCSDFSKVWPSESDYLVYLKTGGGIGVSVWNMLKSELQNNNNEAIILGDLFEIIVGRKLDIGLRRSEKINYFQRKNKIKTFKSNSEKYILDNITDNLLKIDEIKRSFMNDYDMVIDLENIKKETKNDVYELFDLFKDLHIEPCQKLEYFNLITYTNPEYRNQIHTARGFINAHSISEDINFINYIVSINPEYRRNNKLLKLLFKDNIIWKKLLIIPQASAPFLPAKFTNSFIIQIQKLLRHSMDIIFYKLEKLYPRFFKSRWRNWRNAYKLAIDKNLVGKYGSNYEDYIKSKSQTGGSLPIPNFIFVNFESVMYLLRKN